MRDDICSIPVSEVFEPKEGCPICRMRDTLEERMLEYIMGAAMMEPDVRVETNKSGFCETHFAGMLKRRNRLSLALILDSHLKELHKELFPKSLLKPDPKKHSEKAEKHLTSCFVCEKIDWGMSRILDTMYRLYSSERDFRALFSEQEYICLPHYARLCGSAKKVDKRYSGEFAGECRRLAEQYLASLCGDVEHFTKMFDYRNTGEDADWGNSKDSIERAVQYLTAGRN